MKTTIFKLENFLNQNCSGHEKLLASLRTVMENQRFELTTDEKVLLSPTFLDQSRLISGIAIKDVQPIAWGSLHRELPWSASTVRHVDAIGESLKSDNPLDDAFRVGARTCAENTTKNLREFQTPQTREKVAILQQTVKELEDELNTAIYRTACGQSENTQFYNRLYSETEVTVWKTVRQNLMPLLHIAFVSCLKGTDYPKSRQIIEIANYYLIALPVRVENRKLVVICQ